MEEKEVELKNTMAKTTSIAKWCFVKYQLRITSVWIRKSFHGTGHVLGLTFVEFGCSDRITGYIFSLLGSHPGSVKK